MAAQNGFRVGEVTVVHTEEHFAKSSADVPSYLRRMLDLLTLFFLTTFIEKPFRFFGSVGAGLTAFGAFIVAILAVQRVLGQSLDDRPI